MSILVLHSCCVYCPCILTAVGWVDAAAGAERDDGEMVKKRSSENQ